MRGLANPSFLGQKHSQDMINLKMLTKSLLLSMTSLILLSPFAWATKMTAPPLPHQKDLSSDASFAPQLSKFPRRQDYREQEKSKALQEEEAKKKAAAAQLKAQQSQAQRQAQISKERQQKALAANNRGVALGQQKRWTEALIAHEEAVSLDPNNKQFRINLSACRCAAGQDRLKAGDAVAAAALFRKALLAAPDNGMAGKLLAEAIKKQGFEPESVEQRLALGEDLAARGDVEGASIEFHIAYQMEASARTYTKMGDTALHYGQVEVAANWYREALLKDPAFGPAHRQLGLIQVAQKDLTGAASSFRKAVIANPKDKVAGQNLLEIWQRQVATNPASPESHLGLAGAMQLTGDFAGADAQYHKLESIDPHHAGLDAGRKSLARAIQHAQAEKHRLTAETLLQQGLRREALGEIHQAVTMEPRNSQYQFMLAECLEALGDYNNAQQAYLNCVRIDPERNKEAAARIRDMQMRISGHGATMPLSPQTNQPAQAEQANQTRQSVDTQTATAAPNSAIKGQVPITGQSLAAQNMPGKAAFGTTHMQSTATPQIANNANNQITETLAKVAEAEINKDHQAAIDILKNLVSTNIQNPELHHRLAVNLLATGQVTDAIAEFRVASLLKPTSKEYAEDLARAMSIHKRSLTEAAGASAKEVATK